MRQQGRETGMKKVLAFMLGGALTAYLYLGPAATAADDAAPVRLDRARIAGIGLTAIPPDAYQDILVGGQLNMRVAPLFTGRDLRVSVFESTPAKTDHRTRPTTEDEFVYVVSGKLVLTQPTGEVQEFLEGDSLVLPAGYKGTWEMQGNYREIAIVPSKRN
jgi:hypothetical protein